MIRRGLGPRRDGAWARNIPPGGQRRGDAGNVLARHHRRSGARHVGRLSVHHRGDAAYYTPMSKPTRGPALKCDVLWTRLVALYLAYVEPGMIPFASVLRLAHIVFRFDDVR